MDRELMEQAIAAYAVEHNHDERELRNFIRDVTGSMPDDAGEGQTLRTLTPSEIERVHDVVVSHNEFNSRRAS